MSVKLILTQTNNVMIFLLEKYHKSVFHFDYNNMKFCIYRFCDEGRFFIRKINEVHDLTPTHEKHLE